MNGLTWFSAGFAGGVQYPESAQYYCRVSGRLIGINGVPLPKYKIKFKMVESLAAVLKDVVVENRHWEDTQKDGYFEVDLIRGADYYVSIMRDHGVYTIKIPDLLDADFFDLFYPHALSLEINYIDENEELQPVVSPVALAVGETLQLCTIATLSNTETEEVGVEYEQDSDLYSTLVDGTLTATAPGTVVVSVTDGSYDPKSADASIKYQIPDISPTYPDAITVVIT